MAKSGDMDKRGIEFTDVKLNLEKLMGAKSSAVTALTGGIKVKNVKISKVALYYIKFLLAQANYCLI